MTYISTYKNVLNASESAERLSYGREVRVSLRLNGTSAYISEFYNILEGLNFRSVGPNALLSGNESDLAVYTKDSLSYPLPDGFEIIAVLGLDSWYINAQPPAKASNPVTEIVNSVLDKLSVEDKLPVILKSNRHPLEQSLVLVARSNNKELQKIFIPFDIRTRFGEVTLVGFGPGDPGLLTIKGLEALKSADVIFHDDLIDHEFLNQFKGEKIYVGKRKSRHGATQEEINTLLLETAITGRNVVRLKGGDPMIFAHGGEETDVLKQSFIKVTVIPGVTSALAAAAITQTPLTYRGINSAVTFVSGHNPDGIDFRGNATMAVYMGASNASRIASNAIRQGRNPETPVLLISDISKNTQEERRVTLIHLKKSIETYKTPLLMIIGDVVGNTIPSQKSVIWATGASYEGIRNNTILHRPVVQIKPLEDYSLLRNLIEKLNSFDWLVFTSRNAVNYFIEQVFATGRDIRSFANIKIASIGEVTSLELSKFGLNPDIQSKDESSQGLLETFKKQAITFQKILIPRSNYSDFIIPEGLTDLGNTVHSVVVYENVIPENVAVPEENEYGAVYFSSSTDIHNYLALGQKFRSDKKYIINSLSTFFKLISSGVLSSQIYTLDEYVAANFYI